MYISRKVLTLSALWSATQLCVATDTVSFPRQEGVKYIENRFIIEYENTTEGNNAKETIVNNPDKSIVLVNEIPSRNIQVVNFSSKESVKKWLSGAKKGVKYIDEGEKHGRFFFSAKQLLMNLNPFYSLLNNHRVILPSTHRQLDLS